MYTNLKILFFLPTLLLTLGGSSPRSSRAKARAKEKEPRHASLLSLKDYGNATVAEIQNPWDSTETLATYILLPRSVSVPDSLPDGTIVRIPLDNSLIYSAVHIGLVNELGAADAIKGVCDAKYINNPEIAAGIAAGAITDCGNSMTPDVERIMALNPDAILLSPYENSATNARIEKLGIPVIQCADYMEVSPLARAEWMKFFGLLFGKELTADSIFSEVESRYLAVKNMTDSVSCRPSVIFDGIYANQWYVPGKNTTAAVYIRDAGGSNPFDSIAPANSLPLSPEQVLMLAQNADFWFVRYASRMPLTLEGFLSEQRIYPQFTAAGKGNVLFCNTIKEPFYDETPFHPDIFLTELASVLHPSLGITPQKHYFSRP